MKKVVLMLGVLVVFAACSDDPAKPKETDSINYFGTPNGTSWIYSNDSIALDGTSHPLNKYDTLKQVKDTTYLGHPAKLMEHYFVNPFGGTAGTTHYQMFEDGSKVYVSQSFLGLFLPDFLVEIFNVLDTIKIADGNAASWNLAEVNADLLSLPIFANIIPAEVSSITGKFKIGFTRGADTVKNGYNTNSFKMKVVFDGNIVISAIPGIPLPFETVFSEIDFYLSKGNGLIAINAKPMQVKAVAKIPIPIPGIDDLSYSLMDMPGLKKILKSN